MMKSGKILGLPLLVFFVMLWGAVSHAEAGGEDAFQNLSWELIGSDEIQTSGGVVQSVCATDDYIICIENVSDDGKTADIVSAYYKNDTDEDGNQVTRYSLARRVQDTCWEHGNGMTYNPETNEIYVALYTNSSEADRGCIYVMDPETLEFVRSIKISDDYNILGIGYRSDTNQYIIQTNSEGGYSFKILDENFQIVEDLGEYASTAKVDNFQDLTVCGDYILNFPLTLNSGLGDYLHVYSISQRQMIADPAIDFHFENVTSDEPESLCEIRPGIFLAAVNTTSADGVREVRFYQTQVPYLLQITSDIRDGQLQETLISGLRKEHSAAISAQEASAAAGLALPVIPEQVLTAAPAALGLMAAGMGSAFVYLRIRRERKRKAMLARRRRAQCYAHQAGLA